MGGRRRKCVYVNGMMVVPLGGGFLFRCFSLSLGLSELEYSLGVTGYVLKRGKWHVLLFSFCFLGQVIREEKKGVVNQAYIPLHVMVVDAVA